MNDRDYTVWAVIHAVSYLSIYYHLKLYPLTQNAGHPFKTVPRIERDSMPIELVYVKFDVSIIVISRPFFAFLEQQPPTATVSLRSWTEVSSIHSTFRGL